MAIQIVTGKKYHILTDLANKVWSVISLWTKASDVEFNDGKTAQAKLGAIDGITSDLNGESETIAASIKAVNQLNNNLVANIYVGADGKLHKVQGGADTVLPFSGNIIVNSITFSGVHATRSIPLTKKPSFVAVCIKTLDINDIWYKDKFYTPRKQIISISDAELIIESSWAVPYEFVYFILY